MISLNVTFAGRLHPVQILVRPLNAVAYLFLRAGFRIRIPDAGRYPGIIFLHVRKQFLHLIQVPPEQIPCFIHRNDQKFISAVAITVFIIIPENLLKVDCKMKLNN